MFRKRQPSLTTITIAKAALEAIFDECDLYDSHETGGRLIGTYRRKGDHYDVTVHGVIGPGPDARRSATSFFQDGDHQERIFRQIERQHPEIEHLGNWHTHHCNGLATLSGGDHDTYTRIVNHEMHNTDFFYALLVVRKNVGGEPRYQTKHFLFRRSSEGVDEIPSSRVHVSDVPAWTTESAHSPSHHEMAAGAKARTPHLQRARDSEFLSEFFPHLRSLVSKRLGTLYWKGPVALINGSRIEAVVVENAGEEGPSYSITISNPEPQFGELVGLYEGRTFRSARQAVMHFRDDINHMLYMLGRSGS